MPSSIFRILAMHWYSEEPRNDRLLLCMTPAFKICRGPHENGRAIMAVKGMRCSRRETEPLAGCKEICVPRRPRTRNLEAVKRLNGETRLTPTSISHLPGLAPEKNSSCTFTAVSSPLSLLLSSFSPSSLGDLGPPQLLPSHLSSPLCAKSMAFTPLPIM